MPGIPRHRHGPVPRTTTRDRARGYGLTRYRLLQGGAALLVAGAVGCTDELPTSHDPGLVPGDPTTVEVRISFEDFARDLQVFAGFGRPSDLGPAILANQYGTLDAHVLVRLEDYPESVTFEDEDEETVTDDDITPVEGTLELQFDTDDVRGEGPFEFSVGVLQERWDPRSAGWELAVDTVGEALAWSEPGGGAVETAAFGQWDPENGDTAEVPLDSATVAEWQDPDDPARGLRIRAETEGTRLTVQSATLTLGVRPSEAPDTIVDETVEEAFRTFIYQPLPEAAEDRLLVGGAPAWRSVFRIELPDRLEEPMEVCQQLDCPRDLTAGVVVFAALVLEGRETQPGFQPADSIPMDVQEVLSPDRLPRSPIQPIGEARARPLRAELFDGNGGSVEIPLTRYVRALLDYRDRGDELPGPAPSNTVALLSSAEPFSLDFATFAGPGDPGAPHLQLLLTFTEGVQPP